MILIIPYTLYLIVLAILVLTRKVNIGTTDNVFLVLQLCLLLPLIVLTLTHTHIALIHK